MNVTNTEVVVTDRSITAQAYYIRANYIKLEQKTAISYRR